MPVITQDEVIMFVTGGNLSRCVYCSSAVYFRAPLERDSFEPVSQQPGGLSHPEARRRVSQCPPVAVHHTVDREMMPGRFSAKSGSGFGGGGGVESLFMNQFMT